MSDQQQAPLHKWEIVSQGELGDNATTYRMRVPGGCLYRYQPNITSPPSSMAFVPDPAVVADRGAGGVDDSTF